MDQWPHLTHLSTTRGIKGETTGWLARKVRQIIFLLNTLLPISPHCTMFTCSWYFLIPCLHMFCMILHLRWEWALCAVPSKWMQITGAVACGHGPRLCTALDVQDPDSQTSHDRMGKFFHPFHCLKDTHFTTQKKVLLFLLFEIFFHDINYLLCLYSYWQCFLTEKINLLLKTEHKTTTNKKNIKAKNLDCFNKQNILWLVQ